MRVREYKSENESGTMSRSLTAFCRAGRRPALFAPGVEDCQLVPLADYAASAALAFSAIAWNAAGSRMARSDSTLRSTTMPDLERPSIKRL